MSECQRMAQNAINLASQATRALTISDWSHQDCKEFLEDLEREFRKILTPRWIANLGSRGGWPTVACAWRLPDSRPRR
jgi:hypothetical protein